MHADGACNRAGLHHSEPPKGSLMNKRARVQFILVAAAAPWTLLAANAQAQETLRIGVNGVMSGEAASWGLVNKYCAETTADLVNAKGGIDIGGKKYRIEIVALDD